MEKLSNQLRMSGLLSDASKAEKSWTRADALSARRERAEKAQHVDKHRSIDSMEMHSNGSSGSHGASSMSRPSIDPALVTDIEEKLEDQTEKLELEIKSSFKSEFEALHKKMDQIIEGINECRRPLQLLPQARSRGLLRGASKGQALSETGVVSELHPDWDDGLHRHGTMESDLSAERDKDLVPIDGLRTPDVASMQNRAENNAPATPLGRSAPSADGSSIKSASDHTTWERLASGNSGIWIKDNSSGSLASAIWKDVLQASNRERRSGAIAAQLSDLNRAVDARGFGWWRDTFMPILIITSVLIPLTQTVEPLELDARIRVSLEVSLDIIFMIEIMLRYVITPSFYHYIANFYIWIDIVASMPLVLRIVSLSEGSALWQGRPPRGHTLEEFLMSVVPALRLAKMLRRFEKFHLLLRAFEVAFEALPVLLFTMSMLVLTFSAMVFMVEDRDNIDTWFKSIWFTIVSMATVGYGDVVPKSPAGYCVVGVLLWCSALYMSIPLGIVGNAFSLVWQDRDRLLLIQRTRERFFQVAFGPEDSLAFFYVFDADKDGSLSLGEFKNMMAQLHMGFSEDRVCMLFNVLDRDMNGKIDDREFVRNLFPKAYDSIYRPSPVIPESQDDGVSSTNFGEPRSNNSRVSFAKQVQVQQVRAANNDGGRL